MLGFYLALIDNPSDKEKFTEIYNHYKDMMHQIIKQQGISYGNEIGGKLGRLYSSAFAAEVDLHVQKCYDTDSSAEKQVKFGKEIYDLFAKESHDENALEDILKRYNESVNGTADINKIKSQIEGFITRLT